MIKKIQAETGARVQFQQNRDEGPGDRRCFLSGNPKQVEQVIFLYIFCAFPLPKINEFSITKIFCTKNNQKMKIVDKMNTIFYFLNILGTYENRRIN